MAESVDTWALDLDVTIEGIDESIQEVRVRDITLTGSVIVQELSLDITQENSNTIDLDVCFVVDGLNPNILESQIVTYEDILKITDLSIEATSEKRYASSAYASKKLYDLISDVNTRVEALESIDFATKDYVNKAISGSLSEEKLKEFLEKYEALLEWFEFDTEANAIKAKYSLYSLGQIAAGGKAVNEEGEVADAVNLLTEWDDTLTNLEEYALGANLGKDLRDRIVELENKATQVTVSNLLTSGTKIGTITIDEVASDIYIPTLATMMGSTAIGSTKSFIYWSGSAWKTQAIPTTLPNPATLTIAGKTYNGSTAVEITASDLGALTSDDLTSALASYLPIAGGTITGNLRLKGSGDYGNYLYFGDGSYCYLYEDFDDHLEIYASKGINLVTGSSGSVTMNGEAILTDAVLDDYATKSYVDSAIAGIDIPSLDDYATKTYVNDAIAGIDIPSLSGYATQTWVKQQGYLTSLPSGLVYQSTLNSYALKTDIPDVSGFLTSSDLSNYATLDDIENLDTTDENVKATNLSDSAYTTFYLLGHSLYATSTSTAYKNQSCYVLQGNLYSAGAKVATQSWVSSQGYLTSVPSEYVTETELSAKGYLTSLPSGLVYQSTLNSYLTISAAKSTYLPLAGGTISGNLEVEGSLKIGGATLSWDSTTGALSINTNMYALGQIAAGGQA